MNILRSCTKKVFNIEGKHALVSFRFLILMLLFFLLLYGQDGLWKTGDWEHEHVWTVLILAAIQLASNIFLAFAPERFLKKGLSVGLFVFDIVLISLAFYWMHGFESDLFLIYFLVVFMTVIARKPSISFSVAGIACLLYGFLFLKTHGMGDILEPSVLIRFSLLLAVAFFSSVIVQNLEMEREVLQSQMQACWMRSEKLVALGEIASGIAHEINNPLTSILGTVQLILSERKKNDSLPQNSSPENPIVSLEDLQIIEHNSMRCRKVVSHLLKFAGEYEFRFEKVDVREPLMEALSFFQSQMKLSRVSVKWENQSMKEDRIVNASSSHLVQVFFHLISNSIHAMPVGGTISIGIERKSVVNERSMGVECVDMTIRDTGKGIPKENIELLFQSFSVGKNAEKGMGLGLAVVNGIVTKHNGKIFAESCGTGTGTKMTVRLPAASCGDTDPKSSIKSGARREVPYENVL